jgi:hypothetical protein
MGLLTSVLGFGGGGFLSDLLFPKEEEKKKKKKAGDKEEKTPIQEVELDMPYPIAKPDYPTPQIPPEAQERIRRIEASMAGDEAYGYARPDISQGYKGDTIGKNLLDWIISNTYGRL